MMYVSGCECPKRLPDQLALCVLLVKSHFDIVYKQQRADVAAAPSADEAKARFPLPELTARVDG